MTTLGSQVSYFIPLPPKWANDLFLVPAQKVLGNDSGWSGLAQMPAPDWLNCVRSHLKPVAGTLSNGTLW